MAPILAYWNIRGLAQPIRLLLEYTGTEFEDKQYECGPAPNYNKSCWFDIKNTLGFDFPNLPYYIDGNNKITQSNAIMRYIARQHDLCGKSEEQRIKVDMLENQAMDFRNGFVTLCYRQFDTKKQTYLDALPGLLKQFSEFMGSHNWFTGDCITFVDFVMYELIDQHLQLDPECLKEYSNLQDFMKRFEELPKIKEYMASDRFMKAPLNNKMAKFGAE